MLGDAETVVELHRLRDRIEAITARAAAAFDRAGAWADDGALTASAWLATLTRHPRSQCRRRLRLGRELATMPVVERAWLAGGISEAHVGALARARTPASAGAFAADEAELVAEAQRLRFSAFGRRLAYWRHRADAEGVNDEAERQHQGRRLHLSRSFEDTWFLDGVLDPVSGAIVEAELQRLDQELFQADWAEARQRLGREPKAAELARAPAQRRADAMVEMARRSAAMPPGGRRPRPLFSVLVGYESFAGPLCELADGTVVSPASLLRWLSEAEVERVVFAGPSRVIDVGVHQRLFTGATRRAVEVRDRQCFHPFCETTVEGCQVDHVIPHAAGGPTTQDNGRLACPAHNRNRHRRRR